MSFSMKIAGIAATVDFLRSKNKGISKGTQVALNRAALFVRGEISTSIARGTNAPVAFDTGFLSRSVDFAVGKFDAIVFSMVPYAKFIEFGTSRRNARPHFRNTLRKSKATIKKILQDQLKNI